MSSKRSISLGNHLDGQSSEERLPLQHGIKRVCSSGDDQSATERLMKHRSESAPHSSRTFNIDLPSFEYSDTKSQAKRRSPSTQPTVNRTPVTSTHMLPQTTMDSLVSPPPSGSAGCGTAAQSVALQQPTNSRLSNMESPNTKNGVGPNRSSGSTVSLPDVWGLASSETLDFPSSCTLDHEEDHTVRRHEIDEYGFDDGLEQDMLQISDIINFNDGDQLPPSSVMQDWDRDSRSREEYDPTLQHSSRQPSPEVENAGQTGETSDPDPEATDFLDNDVDWDAVYSIVKDLPRDPSLVGSGKMRQSMLPRSTHPGSATSSDSPQAIEAALQPFTRPPFPDRVNDEPSIPGASDNTVLRTCFRIGHMISLASQDAVFDFFARVMYSARETLAIKQHFQFMDLFKDQHHYPSGTLTGWRVGGLMDRESYVFISTRQPKLCRCLGKLKRDQKASSGWFIEIMAIRQVTWEDIESAKTAISGVKAEDGGPPTVAKL
ncbi:hypothetical protein KJ359_000268 [Pestalotiopsis sp. 9143b]|nr:hypothetical protein KJ359_000268 [Pestalotiopsis sp. 9143b]